MRWSRIILIFCLLIDVWYRAHTFGPRLRNLLGAHLWPAASGETEPLDCDEAAYAYIGHRIRSGDVLYRDLTENKPPSATGSTRLQSQLAATTSWRSASCRSRSCSRPWQSSGGSGFDSAAPAQAAWPLLSSCFSPPIPISSAMEQIWNTSSTSSRSLRWACSSSAGTAASGLWPQQDPKSKIQNPTIRIQNPKSKIQKPTTRIQNLTSRVAPKPGLS